MSSWLQGGPFLEISFLHEESRNDKSIIKQMLNTIFEINDIELVENDIDEKINAFENGYCCNEELHVDIHSMQIPLYINLSAQRKSLLRIDRVSSDTLMVNFSFFGSIFDAKEWDQIGIKEENAPSFEYFLKNLFYLFNYKVGGIAFENDIIGMFDCDVAYPNACYSLKNLNPRDILKKHIGFVVILWNEKHQILNELSFPFERIGQDGILIRVGNFV